MCLHECTDVVSQHVRLPVVLYAFTICLILCCGVPAFPRHLLQPSPHGIYQTFAYTALQAVRAAAEARQPPSDGAPDHVHQKASTKPMGPKKAPAALKPPKAKPVFVRKRSSTDAAAIQATVSPHLACGCLWQLAQTQLCILGTVC